MKGLFFWRRIDTRDNGLAYRFCMIVSLEAMRTESDPRGFIAETQSWCRDQFGESGTGRWFPNHIEIEFTEQADAIAFRMRWC